MQQHQTWSSIMSNFHVTPNGVLKCADKTGRCPYLKGETNNHFSDPVKAEKEFSDRMVKQNGQFATMNKPVAMPQFTFGNSRLTAAPRNSGTHQTAMLFQSAGNSRSTNRPGFASKLQTARIGDRATNLMVAARG